jgi:hypothetical protein
MEGRILTESDKGCFVMRVRGTLVNGRLNSTFIGCIYRLIDIKYDGTGKPLSYEVEGSMEYYNKIALEEADSWKVFEKVSKEMKQGTYKKAIKLTITTQNISHWVNIDGKKLSEIESIYEDAMDWDEEYTSKYVTVNV